MNAVWILFSFNVCNLKDIAKALTEEKFCQMEHHTSDIRKINWNVRYYLRE